MTYDEADDVLRDAIQRHAETYDICRPDELLSEYAVVASWQPITDDGTTRYTTQFHRETIPAHTAVGLFRAGEHMVWDSDEP